MTKDDHLLDDLPPRWQRALRSWSDDMAPSEDGWLQIERRAAAPDYIEAEVTSGAFARRALAGAVAAAAVVALGVAVAAPWHSGDGSATAHEGAPSTSVESGTPTTVRPQPSESAPNPSGPTAPPETPAYAAVTMQGLPEGSVLDMEDRASGVHGEARTILRYSLPGVGSTATVIVAVSVYDGAEEDFAATARAGTHPAFGVPYLQEEVRAGTPALFAEGEFGGGHLSGYRWIEGPDVNVEVTGNDLPRDVLRQIVEGIEITR